MINIKGLPAKSRLVVVRGAVCGVHQPRISAGLHPIVRIATIDGSAEIKVHKSNVFDEGEVSSLRLEAEPITLKRRSKEDRLLYILRKASEAIEKGDGRLCADILRTTLLMEELE